MVRVNLRRRFQRRVSILRRCICRFLDHILVCSSHGKSSSRYLVLTNSSISGVSPPPLPPLSSLPPLPPVTTTPVESNESSTSSSCQFDSDDLVALKVCILGDCEIGKSSFLAKYVGKEKERGEMEMEGMNSMEKTLLVKDARISFSIWEVQGDSQYKGQIPVACENSVAIIFMFDLTSRRTLNSVINWYQQARKFNQTAIPILVGTKFDDFIQLPIDLQWTIASQARAYAKAINATLFFSSATYNINVNKIFKFITAKLFDLPWSVERNLTLGEPIIDF